MTRRLDSRKEHKPKHSAVGMAAEMGVRILTEEEYRHLQSFGPVDTKTSSWIETPADIRERRCDLWRLALRPCFHLSQWR